VRPHHGQGYVTPIDSIGYQAANMAYIQNVWRTCNSCFVPEEAFLLALFEKELKRKLLMGFGLDSDAIHSPNEHFGIFNYQRNRNHSVIL
jgi:hypothetical protein